MPQLAVAPSEPSGSSVLSYPLSKKALAAAFVELAPEAIEVTRSRGTSKWQEATVDGAWSLRRLRAQFKRLGFRPIGAPDQLLFVNEAQDVGLQCMGAEPHPTQNTWRTYSIEVQSRPKPRDDASAGRQTSTLLWHNP